MPEPKMIVLYLLVINLVSFMLYGIDKWKAKHADWRISENNLLLSGLLGGAFGSLIAMHLFHHKTLKAKFKFGVPVLLILNIAILAALYLIFYAPDPLFRGL